MSSGDIPEPQPVPVVDSLDISFLNFQEGFVPIRAAGARTFPYIYNTVLENPSWAGAVSDTLTLYGVLVGGILNVPDILNYASTESLLAVRMGVSPGDLRVYTEFPQGTKINTIPSLTPWGTSVTQFGWTDGIDSPYYGSRDQGIRFLVPPQTDLRFYFLEESLNPPITYPILRLDISVFVYEYLTDPKYVWNLLNGVYPKRAKSFTMGDPASLMRFSTTYRNMKHAPHLVVPYDVGSEGDVAKALAGA